MTADSFIADLRNSVRSLEIIHLEKRERNKKKNQERSWNLWEIIHRANVSIISVPGRQRKEKFFKNT